MHQNIRYFDPTTSFRVIPMRFGHSDSAARLAGAIRTGLTASEDPRHPGFFTTEVDGVRYYFHVFDRNWTVYLVADAHVGSEVEPEPALLTH
jgi:hypothetical protein